MRFLSRHALLLILIRNITTIAPFCHEPSGFEFFKMREHGTLCHLMSFRMHVRVDARDDLGGRTCARAHSRQNILFTFEAM